MQNKLTQAVRRETELRTIIGIKTRECTSKIGKSSFEEIISFFRSKLNV
jgi:hypothetical protein